MDRPIEVFVKERVLVVPNASRRVGHFVAHEPDTVVSRIGLDPVDCCASPSPDSRLHPRCGSVRAKAEIRSTTHNVLTVGGVVKHVAFRRVSLAPGILMRSHVLRFGKIARALIECCIQIIGFHQNPVRGAGVIVAAVVVRV